MHGGLSPEMVGAGGGDPTNTTNINTEKIRNRNHDLATQLNSILRPTDIPDRGLLCDLLWSDPEEGTSGWGENDRGVSYTFGEDVVEGFCREHELDLICRAHQVVQDGYQFFSERRLVTVFSAPNYCGEFDNAAAMLCMDEEMVCSFQVLRPVSAREGGRSWL